MKIKGNMKKATMFTPDLFPKPTPENVAKYMAKHGGAAPSTGTTQAAPSSGASSSGLKSDQLFEMMGVFMQRGEGKHLIEKVNAVYAFEIIPEKGKPTARRWIIDLKNGNGAVNTNKVDTVDATFTMTDDDFVQVCNGKLNPQQAFMTV